MSDEPPPIVSDAAADLGPPAEAMDVTVSGIPLSRATTRTGVLTWNGSEVEVLPRYPADSRWVAWPNRGHAGGWWLGFHEYVRGEHLFCGNGGPYPRAMVEEVLEQRNNRKPVSGDEAPRAMVTPAAVADVDLDRAALEAAVMDANDAAERRAEDAAEPQETAPTTSPEGYGS